MDKIIFIDDGKILAVGNHKELYETSPEYRTMVDLPRLDDLESSHDAKEVAENV